MSCHSIYVHPSGFHPSSAYFADPKSHPYCRANLNAVGITSDKPKVGGGNGSAHVYHSYFAREGFAGACYMTPKMFQDFLKYLARSSLTITANVLSIHERDRNVYEARHCHVFFKTDADIFVFKSYLADAPDNLKIRQSNAIIEPYLYRFR